MQDEVVNMECMNADIVAQFRVRKRLDMNLKNKLGKRVEHSNTAKPMALD